MNKIIMCNNNEEVTVETDLTTLKELKDCLKQSNVNITNAKFKDINTGEYITEDSYSLITMKVPSVLIDRKSIVAKVRELVANNPELKKEIGNFTIVKSNILLDFIAKYDKPITPVEEIKPTSSKSNSSEVNEEIIKKLKGYADKIADIIDYLDYAREEACSIYNDIIKTTRNK